RLYRLLESRDPNTGDHMGPGVDPSENIHTAGLTAIFAPPAEVAIAVYLSGNEELKQGILRDHIESVRIAFERIEKDVSLRWGGVTLKI
ncbi:MAG: hypothetical protein L0220_16960, partial [Acidobacteria bacterium]|nr:hypothetical protein [Acidobacteriota bacterium]